MLSRLAAEFHSRQWGGGGEREEEAGQVEKIYMSNEVIPPSGCYCCEQHLWCQYCFSCSHSIFPLKLTCNINFQVEILITTKMFLNDMI